MFMDIRRTQATDGAFLLSLFVCRKLENDIKNAFDSESENAIEQLLQLHAAKLCSTAPKLQVFCRTCNPPLRRLACACCKLVAMKSDHNL
jgi:hypothetical protein